MNFESLPNHLYARLKAARAEARATISEAKLRAEQLREQAREEAALCSNDSLVMYHLKQEFDAAARLVQEAHEKVAWQLLFALFEIRRLAGENPAEIAQELESGVPAWVRDELVSIPTSSPLEGVLKSVVARLCQHYWQMASVPELPQAGRGIPSDVVDHVSEPEIRGTTAGAEKEPLPALGRNLNRLRLECGWSLEELAKATEIDKKLVVGHVSKGKNAHPSTLAAYATAFSQKLGRTVTVAELAE